MKQRFNWTRYHQRSQAETVFSMLKRNLGSWVRGRSYWSQCRELMLKVITHNVMILYLRVFYGAIPGEFPGFLLRINAIAPTTQVGSPLCPTQK
jgi:hypothetical protein